MYTQSIWVSLSSMAAIAIQRLLVMNTSYYMQFSMINYYNSFTGSTECLSSTDCVSNLSTSILSGQVK